MAGNFEQPFFTRSTRGDLRPDIPHDAVGIPDVVANDPKDSVIRRACSVALHRAQADALLVDLRGVTEPAPGITTANINPVRPTDGEPEEPFLQENGTNGTDVVQV